MLTFSTHQKKKKWLIKPPGIKEPVKGFEPPAGGLQNRCSTPELHRLALSARRIIPASTTLCQPLFRTSTFTPGSKALFLASSISATSLETFFRSVTYSKRTLLYDVMTYITRIDTLRKNITISN